MAYLVWLVAISSAASGDPLALNVAGSLTSSTLGGVAVGAGEDTADQLSTVGGAVSADGFGGVSVWGLLGGNSAGPSFDVVIDSAKNAILRSYLLATIGKRAFAPTSAFARGLKSF